MWDVANLQEQKRFEPDIGVLRNLIPLKDGKRLLLGGSQKIVIWDLEKQQEVQFVGEHEPSLYNIGITPDEDMVVSAGKDATVRIWDVAGSGEISRFSNHMAPVKAVAVSSNGRYIASGGDDQMLRIFDLRTRREVSSWEHRQKIIRLAFASQGDFLYVLDEIYEVHQLSLPAAISTAP